MKIAVLFPLVLLAFSISAWGGDSSGSDANAAESAPTHQEYTESGSPADPNDGDTSELTSEILRSAMEGVNYVGFMDLLPFGFTARQSNDIHLL